MKNKRAVLGVYSLVCISAMLVGIVLTFAIGFVCGAIVFGAGFVGFAFAILVGSVWNKLEGC